MSSITAASTIDDSELSELLRQDKHVNRVAAADASVNNNPRPMHNPNHPAMGGANNPMPMNNPSMVRPMNNPNMVNPAMGGGNNPRPMNNPNMVGGNNPPRPMNVPPNARGVPPNIGRPVQPVRPNGPPPNGGTGNLFGNNPLQK